MQRLSAVAAHLAAGGAPTPGATAAGAGDDAPPGPLDGVKVLDMTTVIAGPLTGGFLADMGADVIKVEKADGVGDGYKHAGTSYRTDEGVQMGSSSAVANRGKRSVVVDAQSPEGVAVIKRLAQSADIFVQNMRPGVVGRLGLDYEALAAVNPDLIYCSISGFGQTGPWSKKMTYDPLVQSSTGMVAAQGRPESQSKRHSLYNGLIVDKTTAMTASQAILAALYARDAKGRGGQHIDLSMYDVGFAYNWVDLFADHYFADEGVTHEPSDNPNLSHRVTHPEGRIRQSPLIPEVFGVAQTKDGKWVTVMMGFLLEHAKHFDRADLLQDPRFKPPLSADSGIILREEIVKTFSRFTFDEIMAKTDEHNLFGAPVRELHEAYHEPQAIHNGSIVIRDDPHLGRVREARPAPVMSGTPLRIYGGPPLYGEHTQEVLEEHGWSEEEIGALREQGVLGPTPESSAEARKARETRQR